MARLDALQEAFLATGAVQCGFCIPGHDHVRARTCSMRNPSPTRAEIQEGLAGNLCRCGGYSRIVDAVRASRERSRSDDGQGQLTIGESITRRGRRRASA